MNKFLKIFFWAVLIISAYHLIRDVLQTFEIHNAFTNIWHRSHVWCGQFCNIVTYPFDLAGIVISAFILKRNKAGVLGLFLIVVLVVWVAITLLP